LDAKHDVTSKRAALAQAEEFFEKVRAWMLEDCPATLREQEAPPPPAPDRSEPSVRVRALQSFVTEYLGITYDGAPPDVVDLPRGLAKPLARGGIVERVDPSTPLHRHPRPWR
jgi:hypothetical protein